MSRNIETELLKIKKEIKSESSFDDFLKITLMDLYKEQEAIKKIKIKVQSSLIKGRKIICKNLSLIRAGLLRCMADIIEYRTGNDLKIIKNRKNPLSQWNKFVK